MEVDSTPSTFDTSTNNNIGGIDWIDLKSPHLKRTALVNKLQYIVEGNWIVRITSPAASGKTSVLQLYEKTLQNTKSIYISFLNGQKSCYELMLKGGIDFINETVNEEIRHVDSVVFIDDAQMKYGDVNFWYIFVKVSRKWLPEKMKFVIVSTHLLIGEKSSSPAVLRSVPKLDRSDFLLSEDECDEFLQLQFMGLPKYMQFDRLKQVIKRSCSGLIGAFRLSIMSLRNRFAKDTHPTEHAVLHYFLSDKILPYLCRCFGESHSDPIGDDFKMIIKKLLVDEKPTIRTFMENQDNESFIYLKEAGILIEHDQIISFSSPLAKRYYFEHIFPDRADTLPESLSSLIRNVICSMSATILQNSTLSGDFPKEAVFQHLFMEGLAMNTPPRCYICPELSKIFPSNANDTCQMPINGAIDFYLDGGIRWGIELLVNGGGIGEHINRFTPPKGKYVSLDVKDYVVVDFRKAKSTRSRNSLSHPNRITVFFMTEDYRSVECLFGENPELISLTLAA